MGFQIENGVLVKYTEEPGVTEVVIPEGVTNIGELAFGRCENMKTLHIPESLTSIDGWAFGYGLDWCIDLHIPSLAQYLQMRIGTAHRLFINDEILINAEIPSGITGIPELAYSGCADLRSITIPESVTDIGKWAFSGCSGLVSATLPVKLYDKWHAFPECRNCSEVHLTGEIGTASPKSRKDALVIFAKDPENLKQPWAAGYLKYAKSNASKLVDQVVAHPELCALMCSEKLIPVKDLDAFTDAAAVSGNAEIVAMLLEYQNQDDAKKGKAKAGKTKEKQNTKVLDRMNARQKKEGVEGLNFVVTGNLKFFSSRKELQKLFASYGAVLASSISSKVDYLIMNPDSADSAKMEKANKLGIEIISEIELLKLFPGMPGAYVAKDGVLNLYYGNEENVILPDGITCIGMGAFANRQNLISISIPESVTSIEANAFTWCYNIANIVIPTKVTSIGEWAFMGCLGLKNIAIPETVTNIGSTAFSGCTNLTISAPAGSYTERFAIEHKISFIAV